MIFFLSNSIKEFSEIVEEKCFKMGAEFLYSMLSSSNNETQTNIGLTVNTGRTLV